MFATVDGISSRQLRATAFADSRWVSLRIPNAYVFDMRRTLSMPTDAALDRFANLLTEKDRPPERIRAIRVEVFRLVRDPQTREYSFALINARTKDLVDEPG